MRNQRKFEVYSLVISVIIVLSFLTYRYLQRTTPVLTDEYLIIVVNHTRTPIKSIAYGTSGKTQVSQNADNSLVKEGEKLHLGFSAKPAGPFQISVTVDDLKIIVTQKIEADFDENRQMQLELILEAGNYHLKTIR